MGYGSHRGHTSSITRASSPLRSATWPTCSATPPGSSSSTRTSPTTCAPSTRQGQLFRLLHAIEKAEPGTHTDFTKPFVHFQNFLHRRGIVVVLSDFYEQPEIIVKTVEPLRYRGNEVILFHILDPQEIKPKFREPVLLVDMENAANALEVSPGIRAQRIPAARSIRTSKRSARKARSAGMEYFLMDTGRPLDEGLREYLSVRQGEILDGFLHSMVSGRRRGRGAAGLAAPAQETQDHAPAVQLADVLRAAHAELHQAPPPALPAAVRAAHRCSSCCWCWPSRILTSSRS